MTDKDATDLTIDQLNDQEALALMALARQIIAMDGRLSEGERDALEDIAAAMGTRRYDTMIERSAQLVDSEEALERYVGAVDRQAAREAIYGALFDLASNCSMDPTELDVLEWVAEEWDLEVQDLDRDEDDDADSDDEEEEEDDEEEDDDEA